MAEIQATLSELVNSELALRRVSELDGFAAKAKYHISKLAQLVAVETKHFHVERAKLFEELGVERDARTDAERAQLGPTVREIPPGALAEFKRRAEELAGVPVTLAWEPIRSVDLPAGAKPSDLIDLGPLCELVDPDPEPKAETKAPK